MALYPPIVASAMPAFAGDEVKIYFSFSSYNTSKDIGSVQATVRRQSSNTNVLVYNSQIITLPWNKENDKYYIIIKGNKLQTGTFEENVLYKVQLRFSTTLPPEEGDKQPSLSYGIGKQYSNDLDNFSQWSTVCIIKRIVPPLFYISQFTTEDEQTSQRELGEEDQNNYYHSFADFNLVYQTNYTVEENGKKFFKQSQPLNKYRLQLFDSNDTILLADSGWLLASAYNYIQDTNSVIYGCSLPYEFFEGNEFILNVSIETRNGYIANKHYPFKVQLEGLDGLDLNAVMHAAVNEEEGYVKLQILINQAYDQNLVLRRSDVSSNFLVWEDIKHFIGTGQNPQTITYYDFTIESGKFYKYLIQKRDLKGRRGEGKYVTYTKIQKKTVIDQDTQESTIVTNTSQEPLPGLMGEWNHAFLLQSNQGDLENTKQLKMKFDFQISNYKYNVLESKTDTLGAKYPFIKRNGDNYYRSFGCSGTITGFMDDADLFTNKQEIFYNHSTLYKEFKGEIGHYVNMYDYTYEKRFREIVEEFLYNAKPKLYKSMQEGNMIIKLMDVSLIPKNELGRLIYTFSATAYEIDDSSITNLTKYNFINPGRYNPELSKKITTIGRISGYKDFTSYYNEIDDLDNKKQLNLNKFLKGVNIINPNILGDGTGSSLSAGSIAEKLNYKKVVDGNIVDDFTINWLRITVEDEPYLIVKHEGSYKVFPDDFIDNNENLINEINEESILYFFKEKPKQSDIYLGTLVYIKGQPIIIAPPNNIYEISDVTFSPSDTIVFAKDTAAIIDYQVEYTKVVDDSTTPDKIRVDRVNGCLQGHGLNVDIPTQLVVKYRSSNEKYRTDKEPRIEKKLQGIKSITIDTEPGVQIEIFTSSDNPQFNFHNIFTVGFTGELHFDVSSEASEYIKTYKILGLPDEQEGYLPVDYIVYYYVSVGRFYY